jgi:hypothetical protein
LYAFTNSINQASTNKLAKNEKSCTWKRLKDKNKMYYAFSTTVLEFTAQVYEREREFPFLGLNDD